MTAQPDTLTDKVNALNDIRARVHHGDLPQLDTRSTEVIHSVVQTPDMDIVSFRRIYGRPEHFGTRVVVIAIADSALRVVATQYKPDDGCVTPPDVDNSAQAKRDRRKAARTAPPISDYDPIKRNAERRTQADQLPLGGLNHRPASSGTVCEVLSTADHRRLAQCDNLTDAIDICNALGTDRALIWYHRPGTQGYEDHTPWRR